MLSFIFLNIIITPFFREKSNQSKRFRVKTKHHNPWVPFLLRATVVNDILELFDFLTIRNK